MDIKTLSGFLSAACFSTATFGKIPPAPPVDPLVAATKAEKDKVASELGKVQQIAAEERAVKNFQANMKKTGKPIPKPTPIIVTAPPGPVAAMPVKPGAASVTPASKVPETPVKK